MPDIKPVTNCFRDWMQSASVNKIFAALDNNARFVGGAVRDAVLGKDAQDIDIATPFHPEEVISRLHKQGVKTVPTGIKHGTITAVLEGRGYEITTLRRDIENFGRHATVAFTDNWEEDAARRDFTINALSCLQNGDIFDYFDGLADLAARRLRFVGSATERCREDYLRILRYLRFFAYYGQQVDMEALLACKELASGIANLSGERIQGEMFKLLAAENPIYSLQLMVQTEVITRLMPGVTASNIALLERLLEAGKTETASPLLRLAVLLGKNPDIAQFIIKTWKLANIDQKRLQFLCHPEHKIPPQDIRLARKLFRQWGQKNFLDLSLMGFAYGLNAENFNLLYALKDWQVPQFPLNGRDITALGLSEGRKIGAILQIVEAWWEEQDYKPAKSDLLAFAREQI